MPFRESKQKKTVLLKDEKLVKAKRKFDAIIENQNDKQPRRNLKTV